MEDKLYYVTAKTVEGTPTALYDGYLNIARDLARVNAKNEEVTTRDGHVYGYLCNFKWTLGGSNSVTLQTAPNTWKMRNSFRKFHAYRDIMFDNAGVEGDEKGRYGKTIRPLLDPLMDSSRFGTNVLDPLTFKGPVGGSGAPPSHTYDKGEWTYTQLATTPIFEEGVSVDPAVDYWADSFYLHICDENQMSGAPVAAGQSGYYKSVGMIHSYNLDRMEVVTPTTAETIDGPSNPLAALIATGNQATGEVIEIAEDQELEKPPYDLDDNGDSIFMNVEGYGVTKSTGGTVSFNAFVPAGLCRYFLPEEVEAVLEVTVLGKVLCKDLA
jgi:PII-like signaling protein